jgi:hypothetical protein
MGKETCRVSQLGEMLGRAERKLDEWGKPGWIGTMIVGFILAWPLGLALLFYMIWSNRMGCWSKTGRRRAPRHETTGNTAFDAYREATLRRLEDEQAAFRDFLEKLRRAKDEAEFEQFMADRRNSNPPQTA